MKKNALSFLIAIITTMGIFAQTPEAFKYQAVVRDNSGDIIAGQLVSVRVSIIQDDISGILVYSETHSCTTNQFGIIVLEIGNGTIETGVFDDINWGTTTHFLKLELDETGGTNWQFMGISQLLSVPYTLNTSSLTLTDENGTNYEVTVDNNGNLITNCTPMPSLSIAGPDQPNVNSPTTLAANTPVNGTGFWTIISGTGGDISNPSDPTASFSGITGSSYTLQWAISTVCDTTYDDVNISFIQTFTCGNPFIDSRDEQTYNTVLIGNQCWMTENMNIGTMINGNETMTDNGVIEKYCYDNNTTNCDEYGGLYQWNEMMLYTTTPGVQGICPTDWHLPTDTEWFNMEHEVDPTITSGSIEWRGVDCGGKLKETNTTHWASPNTGATNESGFTALPGGFCIVSAGVFFYLGYEGYWLSSTEYSATKAWYRSLSFNNNKVNRNSITKVSGFSVRCLKDDFTPVNQPPQPPSSPSPENGAEYQIIEVDISWTCIDPEGDPLSYDIYFGTETPPPLVNSGQTETTYDPGTLENIKEYFWMIVAHDDHSNATEGPVWNFATGVNLPPGSPTSPSPENEAGNQLLELDLSWTCTDPEGDPLSYDIYFGTVNPPPLVYSGQALTTYYPGLLEYNTEYFWMIVAHDNHNNSTIGPDWNFITKTETFYPTCPGTPTVTHGGQVYNTILIGEQCWLKENLNIGTYINSAVEMTDNGVIEKYCFTPSSCDEYGGLYQWDEMMGYNTTPGGQGICPNDWHIPTDGEWTILTEFLGGWSVAGGKMKEAGTLHWSSPNTGATNESGFTTLPGGYRSNNGYFFDALNYARFWSSTKYNDYQAWGRNLSFDSDNTERNSYHDIFGFSVRCMKGAPPPVNQPPEPPELPLPEDGAVNQPIEPELSWDCTDPDGDPLTYDVYFGTVNPPPLVYSGQALTTYYPGILEVNTEYFWIIVAHDNHSNTTVGPDWSFTTGTHTPCPGIPTVTYEGQVYNTVLIGEQCWLKENLNVGTMINGTVEMANNGIIEKYCYNDSTTNCDEYGALYQWNEIMEYVTDTAVQGICPEGWHLPTDYEWKILEGTVDSQYPVGDSVWNNYYWRGYDAGLNLKSTTGWYPGSNGSGLYSFEAFPCGYLNITGNFSYLTFEAYFWSSSELNLPNTWIRRLGYTNDNVKRTNSDKRHGYSVRCLKDEN